MGKTGGLVPEPRQCPEQPILADGGGDGVAFVGEEINLGLWPA